MAIKPKQKKHIKRGDPLTQNPRAKYDWAKEKQDFFKSDFIEVKAYFEQVHGVYNGNITKKTNGWTIEKQAWEAKQSEDVIKKIGEDRVKAAHGALSRILKIAIEDVERVDGRRNSKSGEPLTALWRLIRTEAGLPSAITKQENIDLNELDEARKLLDDRLKNEKAPTVKKGRRAKAV